MGKNLLETKEGAKRESSVDSRCIRLPFHVKLRNQGSISMNKGPLGISNTLDITSKLWLCIRSRLQHSCHGLYVYFLKIVVRNTLA